MRLLLTAVRCEKGDLEGNLRRHLELLDRGAAASCDLVLLPELSLTGSAPAAAVPLEDPHVVALAHASRDGPAVCFGLAEAGPGAPDPRPAITQVVASAGRIVHVHRKAGVATDEQEHYRVGEGSDRLDLGQTSTMLALCAEIGLETAYASAPDLILGPAAPGLYGPRRATTDDWRRGFDWWRGQVLSDTARLLGPESVLAVSTQAGATVDQDFPGWCGVVAPSGRVVVELPTWQEGCLAVDLPGGG